MHGIFALAKIKCVSVTVCARWSLRCASDKVDTAFIQLGVPSVLHSELHNVIVWMQLKIKKNER